MLAARALDTPRLTLEAPDARWAAIRDDVAVARASLWWRNVPAWTGRRVAFVGHYAAADLESGAAVLEQAVGVAAAEGAEVVVGPLDGTTWRSYRLVIERGEAPPFFMEPEQPDAWPAHFAAAGFAECARYTSAVVDPLVVDPAEATAIRAKLATAGYRCRPLDMGNLDRELDQIFTISLAAFADNLFYTPISRKEFLAQYQRVLPVVDPRLVLMAEHESAGVVGYVFTVPDMLERPVDGRRATAIVKTLAVHPDHGGRGLGGALTALCQHEAAGLGYTRIIHALMLETNVSQRISRRDARTFRRYALFSRACR